MKKMKLWMMLFCIGLLFVSGGVAEEIALDLTQMARFETASSLCWIDDSLYVLGNKGVYSWKSGSEKMNTVIDLTAASNYDYVQDCPEDESEAAVWNQMLQLIFTDGETLYGLHPYSGMIKKIEGNTQTNVAEIQQEYLYSEDMEAYREIRQAVYTDKKLYLLLGTDTYEEYDKTELCAFDLDTSEMELVDIEGVNAIMLGAEGTLLIQTNDALSSAAQYDVESGTLGEEVLTVGEDERIAGVAWDAVDQRYVRFVQGQVVTCDANGNEIVKAYIPVFDATENVPAACSTAGLYALANGRYIFIRDITGLQTYALCKSIFLDLSILSKHFCFSPILYLYANSHVLCFVWRINRRKMAYVEKCIFFLCSYRLFQLTRSTLPFSSASFIHAVK